METKKLSDLFIEIDKNPAAAEAMLKIAKSQITVPQIELDGMEVVDRIVLSTDKPIRTNAKGETTNDTRVSGTGTRDESLIGSFEQGIDLTKFPPRLTQIGEDEYELFGGFGRSEIFKELDYQFWIYDVYKVDTGNANKFQLNAEDIKEDAALADNGFAASKPLKKADYLRALKKRIRSLELSDNEEGRETLKAWLKTVTNCVSKTTANDYVNDAFLQLAQEDGNLESVKPDQVKSAAMQINPRLMVINTSDCVSPNGKVGNTQRLARLLHPAAKQYNATKKPVEFVLHNSTCTSHEMIDQQNKGAQAMLDQVWKDISMMVGTSISKGGENPFKANYVYNQKKTTKGCNTIQSFDEHEWTK